MTDNKKTAIIAHIDKIEQYARKDGNGWLLTELEKRFGNLNQDYKIAQDIKEIRAALQIRGQNSISYSFISNAVLRNQLLVDNLRMENFALDLQSIDETERFYYYCVNAFYQIENLLNYFFYVRFPQLDDLIQHIEKHTVTSKHPYLHSGNEQSVGDISVEKKIFAFCDEFFPYAPKSKDFTHKTLSELRQVRNEGLHRCDIIKDDKNEKLYNFFRYQNFNSIRALLKKVSAKIEDILTSKYSRKKILRD